jgi:hypothetical protein
MQRCNERSREHLTSLWLLWVVSMWSQMLRGLWYQERWGRSSRRNGSNNGCGRVQCGASRHFARSYLEEGGGTMLKVSSVTGLRAHLGLLPWCVSKAAVGRPTRCLRWTWRRGRARRVGQSWCPGGQSALCKRLAPGGGCLIPGEQLTRASSGASALALAGHHFVPFTVNVPTRGVS